MHSIKQFWATSSNSLKAALVAGFIGLLLIVGFGVHWYHASTLASVTKEKAALKTQLQQKTDAYNQLLGEAHAHEAAAREDKAKSDLMRAEYEKRIGNVKALDTKLVKVETDFAKAKEDLGDCGATDEECLKRLCLELQKAGFKVTCE